MPSDESIYNWVFLPALKKITVPYCETPFGAFLGAGPETKYIVTKPWNKSKLFKSSFNDSLLPSVIKLSKELDNLITNQILVEKIKIQGKGTGIIGWQTIEIKLSKIKTILGVSAVPIRSQSQIDFLSYSITSIKYRVYSSSGEPVLSTNSYVFEILVFGY